MRVTDREAFEQIQRRAEALSHAGKGLEGIGLLLGASAGEHNLTEDDRDRLAHAVLALGTMVYDTANEAWGYSAPDREEWVRT